MIEQIFETNTVSMTLEDIQDWLATQIAEQLGRKPEEIDIKLPFDSYGLDSVQIVSITNLGKQYFGLQISPLVLWNYPNIESFSRYLLTELKTAKLEIFEI
jgi:acyl carrier protein